MATLYLVRHGETPYNVNGLCQGDSYEIPLTELGERQAAQFGKNISHLDFDRLFCSPLLRAKRTLEIILENYTGKIKNSEITYLHGFREKSFGVFHHQHRSKYQEHIEKSGLPYHLFKFEGGENSLEFFERVKSTLDELKMQANNNAEKWLCISHGGVLQSLHCQFNNLGWEDFRKLVAVNLAMSSYKLHPELEEIAFNQNIIGDSLNSSNPHM